MIKKVIFYLSCAKIDPKPCNPRSLQKPKRSNSYPKVFLGGLPFNITETDLRQYFQRFGKVMEVVIMYDQEKKKSRGEWWRMYITHFQLEWTCSCVSYM
jgi:RNA-binding protein Musashi